MVRALLCLPDGRVLVRHADARQFIVTPAATARITLRTVAGGTLDWQPATAGVGSALRRAAGADDDRVRGGRLVVLADGQMLAVRPVEDALTLATPWGPLSIPWDDVAVLERAEDAEHRHWIGRLADGSRLPVFPPVTALTWRGGRGPVTAPGGSIRYYQGPSGGSRLLVPPGTPLPAALRSTTELAALTHDGTLAGLVARAAEHWQQPVVLAEDAALYATLACPLTLSGDARSQLAGLLRETGLVATLTADGSIRIHDPERVVADDTGDDRIVTAQGWILLGRCAPGALHTADGAVLPRAGLRAIHRADDGLWAEHADRGRVRVHPAAELITLHHAGGTLRIPYAMLATCTLAAEVAP